jgi:laccase
LIPVVPGRELEKLEPSRKATTARWFTHNTTVEVGVPEHRDDAERLQPDAPPWTRLLRARAGLWQLRVYDLVDPILKNTVQVPRLGWAAIRFVTDNLVALPL